LWDLRIYELTDSIVELPDCKERDIRRRIDTHISQPRQVPTPRSPTNVRGIGHAKRTNMNPHAEALKKRTFDFALRVVYFCRALRTTWEGAEFADQIFRSARV
jgi:hypothetical protein